MHLVLCVIDKYNLSFDLYMNKKKEICIPINDETFNI